jgi:pimeloyl-ACP methyl ester carboxylesterase
MIQTTKVAHRTVKVCDLDVFYREAGPKDGPAIFLLHGFPTSSQMFRNLIRPWPAATACSLPTTPATVAARCRRETSSLSLLRADGGGTPSL